MEEKTLQENLKNLAKELERKLKEKKSGEIPEKQEKPKIKEAKEKKKPAKELDELIKIKAKISPGGTLVPLEDYIKYAVHLGTKVITPNMRKYVYKRRADGLAVLNTNLIDEKLKEAIEFFKNYNPEDVFLACKREAGWEAAEKFSEITGINVFTKKYPAGIITNTELKDFFETELIIICDPWLDKNALKDATITKKPVISLCDANNLTTGVTKVIPCNNKSKKSVGLILYILARGYCHARKIPFNAVIEDFTGPAEEKEN